MSKQRASFYLFKLTFSKSFQHHKKIDIQSTVETKEIYNEDLELPPTNHRQLQLYESTKLPRTNTEESTTAVKKSGPK